MWLERHYLFGSWDKTMEKCVGIACSMESTKQVIPAYWGSIAYQAPLTRLPNRGKRAFVKQSIRSRCKFWELTNPSRSMYAYEKAVAKP